MTIITLSDASLQTDDWQWQLKNAIRDVEVLASMLDIHLDDVPTSFPLVVPLPYLARIEIGNPGDPLLLQVLPQAIENQTAPGFSIDPVGELQLETNTKGLIQKYHGRALVITTGACGINCRYCFRRHFPYVDHQPSRQQWKDLTSHLASDQNISEVILSGGDPLVMNDAYLQGLIEAINHIDHIDTIRIHTRLPVVIPQRINQGLLNCFSSSSKKMVVVIHTNHPNEIDESVTAAMSKLASSGVTLLNQSVLLRGINDSADILVSLSKKLFQAGVLPYYLHLLDPVAGAQHFDVKEGEALDLVRQVTGKLPGYLVPKLVREIAGADAKQSLGASFVGPD
jgi:EF-P beta-lysylation protein EpmB